MKHLMNFFWLVLIVGGGCRASAQDGSVFTYQGRLTFQGKPAEGSHDLRLALFDAPVMGNQVGDTVTNLNVTVSQGVLTTGVDFGTSAFTGAARWLEISVRPGGSSGTFTLLSPRQEVRPVPYTLHAASADIATSARALPWDNLTGVPAGFADGADQDTLYTAGGGLKLSGTTFSIAPGGVGATELSEGSITAAKLATKSVTSNKIDWATISDLSWELDGNAGTTPGTHFLGTTDDRALELRVNNRRALRLVPDALAPNLIAGADSNVITNSIGSVIGGGAGNLVTNADHAVIPGGSSNRVSADLGFAAGYLAKATNRGAFVWADGHNASFGSTGTNQFRVRALGGAEFITAVTNTDKVAARLSLTSTGGVSIVSFTNQAPALELRQGYLKVPGITNFQSGAPVFIHRMTAGNTRRDLACTVIDHPLCNADPHAVLLVTPNENPGDATGLQRLQAYGPVSVFYTGDNPNFATGHRRKWALFFITSNAQPYEGTAYNVLVIKP